MKNLLKWNVTKDTAVGTIAGLTMIAISLLMLPFSGDSILDKTMYVFLRDFCMIFGLGVVFVTSFCAKKGRETVAALGFTKKKIWLSLLINIVLAVALMLIFMKRGAPTNLFSLENLYGTVKILVAGIFEMTFIYGFLRMTFEKAFGIIPAIILTSVFYSFHHVGFQPEFVSLFFVGIMYVTVFYITRNLVIIFPFFWAVGALWDVLVDSSVGGHLKNSLSFYGALGILLLSAIWLIIYKKLPFFQKKSGERNANTEITSDAERLVKTE